jgi:mRNA-degrading endonuclease RelE of RelBE toxin-antitoxin system
VKNVPNYDYRCAQDARNARKTRNPYVHSETTSPTTPLSETTSPTTPLKLGGKLAGQWAFSIDEDYRVLFEFIDSDSVLLIDIGTHDEVY